MRMLALIAACFIASLPASAQPPAADEAVIKEVVRKYVEARDKRDPKSLEALFTPDADQLVTTGEWRQGRENVVKGGLASSQANPGSRQITIEVVRFVAPDVAIADGRYEIAGAAGASPRKMRTTFVMTRRGSSAPWLIAAIRNMAPTEPPK